MHFLCHGQLLLSRLIKNYAWICMYINVNTCVSYIRINKFDWLKHYAPILLNIIESTCKLQNNTLIENTFFYL